MVVCLPAAALQVVTLEVRSPGSSPGITDLYLQEPVATTYLQSTDDGTYPIDGIPVGARSFASGVRSIDFAGGVAQDGPDNINLAVRVRGTAGESAETVSAIPEPGSYALILASLVAMGFIWRRRRG